MNFINNTSIFKTYLEYNEIYKILNITIIKISNGRLNEEENEIRGGISSAKNFHKSIASAEILEARFLNIRVRRASINHMCNKSGRNGGICCQR